MNGYDVTQRIKSIRPDLPVITQTANAADEDKTKCINAGCDHYISKPIHLESLYTILNGYLFNHKK